MAHFAEIENKIDPTGFTQNSLWVVKRITVVANDIVTADGPLGENDMHVDGEKWCINFFKGGVWKQTSYNNNFRKQYAIINCTFDFVKNKFIKPQPFASWSLDANDDWQAPVAYPTVLTYGDNVRYFINWDEAGQRWIGKDDQNNEFVWNSELSSWSTTGN
jgi:hypothetical protein